MKRYIILLFLLLCSACLANNGPAYKPIRVDHHHHGFTQHYARSFFQISDNGLYSVEAMSPSGAFTMGKNSLDIIIHNRKDQDVAAADISLVPWMPIHGHGSPEVPTVEEKGGGLYTVKNLYFPMAGPWELRVTVKKDGVEDKTAFTVPVGTPDQIPSVHQHVALDKSKVDYGKSQIGAARKYMVSYTAVSGDNTPLNRMVQWKVHVDDALGTPVDGAKIEVGGGMPEHGHGLPTKPRITEELGGGDYLLEGLKFTMPGWWQVTLKIHAADGDDNVTFNLTR